MSAARAEEVVSKTDRSVKKKLSGLSKFLDIGTSLIHLSEPPSLPCAGVQERYALKVEETEREPAELLEAQHARCFSAVSQGKVRKYRPGLVSGSSSDCQQTVKSPNSEKTNRQIVLLW